MTEIQAEDQPAPDQPQQPGSGDPEQPPSKEVEKVKVALDRPISDLDEAWRLASAVVFADILPQGIRNKRANALVIMMYGRDLGMTPMQAFQTIYVVNGKPHLGAEGWTALARKAGHKVRWLQSTREIAEVQIVLADDPDHPHREQFTIDDALAAGLCTRDKDGNVTARDSTGRPKPWELYTKRMLQARCLAFAIRAVAPEVALGYGIQEMGEAEYDVDRGDNATTVEVGQPASKQPTRSTAANQADVLAAEARFKGQTINDPPLAAAPADDPETVDAEVVDEPPQPNEPLRKQARQPRQFRRGTKQATTAAAPAPEASTVDEDATLFARADEQAEQDLHGSDADADDR